MRLFLAAWIIAELLPNYYQIMVDRNLKSLLCIKLRLLALFLCLMMSPGKALSSEIKALSSEIDVLFQLVNERLVLMKEVAAYKFANGIEIENRSRETVVLQRAMQSAERYQLDPESVETFFRLQIKVAKVVQQGWINYWIAQGFDHTQDAGITDLNAEIRPKLINLGDQIIRQLSLALPQLQDCQQFAINLSKARQTIDDRFVSAAIKQQLIEAMAMIKRRDAQIVDQLTEIKHRGVLRVGTTGDYKPFSFLEADSGRPTGIDIDLAQELAKSLGVELKLVATTWPTLMDDLAANQFDIGMSGITRTRARQRTAFFSDQYSIGGKTPIARCEVRDKFNSLASIDKAGVRVIVNPGGTNEKYVQQNIKHAQIIVHPDNTTIFEQIINNYADVMITDAIEVKVQEVMQPELCGTMPDQLLSRAEKAFLMPQDSALQGYVNAWLSGIKRSGDLEVIFARYLGGEASRGSR